MHVAFTAAASLASSIVIIQSCTYSSIRVLGARALREAPFCRRRRLNSRYTAATECMTVAGVSAGILARRVTPVDVRSVFIDARPRPQSVVTSSVDAQTA